jgi:hypothetical protein
VENSLFSLVGRTAFKGCCEAGEISGTLKSLEGRTLVKEVLQVD